MGHVDNHRRVGGNQLVGKRRLGGFQGKHFGENGVQCGFMDLAKKFKSFSVQDIFQK